MKIKDKITQSLASITVELQEISPDFYVIGASAMILSGIEVGETADIDILTTEMNSCKLQHLLKTYMEISPETKEDDLFRSNFARFKLPLMDIEVMGDLQIKKNDIWQSVCVKEYKEIFIGNLIIKIPTIEEQKRILSLFGREKDLKRILILNHYLLTKENLSDEHLCCIIRSKKPHAGIDAKRQWLSDRLNEGHVFRKLNAKATVFIEYAPLETAWVPIIGDNYYYLYCLWVLGSPKGNGYGRALMEYCLTDAKEKGKSGVCMLGSKKQKNWLSDQSFAKKFGFEVVDATDNGYELLALSFDGTMPKFAQNAKKMKIESEDLTIYYDMQCPYIYQKIEMVKQYCDTNNVPVSLIQVDTLQKAKDLPCVFNNWGVFYKGNFETVNLLLDVEHLKRILKK